MPPRRAAVVAALAAWGLAAAALRAQVVREKVSVEVVTIRLTARDASGASVDDLSAVDLALLVDGQPVAIDTLTRPSPAAVVDDREGPPTIGAPKRIRTLIFFDEGATSIIDRRVVFDELERLLEAERSRSRRDVMVGRFGGSGLEIACPWTSQADQAIAALRQLRGTPSFNRMPGPSGLGASGTPVVWYQTYGEHLHHALLEALAAFPDDSADRQLVVVSGGTTLMRPSDLASVLRCQMSPAERTRLQLIDSDVSRAHAREIERATFALWSRAVNPSGHILTMSDVVAKAIERDVAMIPIAAEAMHRDHDLGFEQRPRRLDQPPGVIAAGDGRMTPRMGVVQAMMEIAGSTGSEPILVPARTGDRLSEIEARPTYVLTFRDPAGNHRYHQIQLTSRRSGVTVHSRRGYRLPTEDERMLDAVVARLVDPSPVPGADPLSARAILSGAEASAGKTALLSIRIEPPRETTPPAQRGITVVGVGEDAGGQRTEPVSWSGIAQAVGDEAGVYALTVKFGVRPEDFRWSLALRDDDTGLISYLVIPATPRVKG
jgi:VWFA-related protein